VNVLDELAVQVVNCADFAGNHPPYDKLTARGVRVVYLNGNPGSIAEGGDPFATAAMVIDVITRGFIAAVFFGMPRDSSDPAAGAIYANVCSAKVDALGGMARVAAVLHDVEKVPLEFQRGFCERWDVIRFGRPTLYSVEPQQDATQNDYGRMLARNATAGKRLRKITTQSYFGGMQPIVPAAMVTYLTDRGVSADDVCPTIDPAQPVPYATSALACGTRGAVLFEAGRIA
jgi:hypothetical protein